MVIVSLLKRLNHFLKQLYRTSPDFSLKWLEMLIIKKELNLMAERWTYKLLDPSMIYNSVGQPDCFEGRETPYS